MFAIAVTLLVLELIGPGVGGVDRCPVADLDIELIREELSGASNIRDIGCTTLTAGRLPRPSFSGWTERITRSTS